ncbi:Hypothetical Protein FCC1311_065192 [Hondaea fermentalgiana]|uniref:Uncharacterized protein n=1 Tax=Hondaea fermentalgiana TaxID=2315210 RepID=A0A2R5GHE6_9STRA|nr:Hypothetical Protein FCC1311_065192 [Hondaea fermentalgiana]|eukprot:GBG30300.1 Hypothetical Protein FCC1311_065192 [Hondaea fermentalgiana]
MIVQRSKHGPSRSGAPTTEYGDEQQHDEADNEDEWEQYGEEMVHFFEAEKYQRVAEEAVAWVRDKRRLQFDLPSKHSRKSHRNGNLFAKLRMSLRVADALQKINPDAPPPEKLGTELRAQLSIKERISIHRARREKSLAWLERQHAKAADEDIKRKLLETPFEAEAEAEAEVNASMGLTIRESISSACESTRKSAVNAGLDEHENTSILNLFSDERDYQHPHEHVLDEFFEAVLPDSRAVHNFDSDASKPFRLGTWLAQRCLQTGAATVPPFRAAYLEGLDDISELKAILNTLDASVGRVSLRGSRVDVDVLDMLSRVTRMNALDLSGCGLRRPATLLLQPWLLSLRRLDLSCNDLAFSEAQCLAEYIRSSKYAITLQELELAGNHLAREGAVLLLEAIASWQEHSSMVELGLSANKIASPADCDIDEELVDLCTRQCPSLRHLDLSRNKLTIGTVRHLACALHPSGQLFGLHVDGNVNLEIVSKSSQGTLQVEALSTSSNNPACDLQRAPPIPLLDRSLALWPRLGQTSIHDETCRVCAGWQICRFRFWTNEEGFRTGRRPRSPPKGSTIRRVVHLHVSSIETPIRMTQVSGDQGCVASVHLRPGTHRFWFSASDQPDKILVCPALASLRARDGTPFHQISLEPRDGPFDPKKILEICEGSPLSRADSVVEGGQDADWDLLRSLDVVRSHFAPELLNPPEEINGLDLGLEWEFPGSRDTVRTLEKSFRDVHKDLCSIHTILKALQAEPRSGSEFLGLVCTRALAVYNADVESCSLSVETSFANALKKVVQHEVKPGLRFKNVDPASSRRELQRSPSIAGLLVSRQSQLRKIFYASLPSRPGSQTLLLSHWLDALRTGCSVCPLLVSQEQAQLIFAQSMDTEALHVARGKDCQRGLTYAGFLEAICRLAAVACLPGYALQALFGVDPSLETKSGMQETLRRAAGAQCCVGSEFARFDLLFRADANPFATPLQRLELIIDALLGASDSDTSVHEQQAETPPHGRSKPGLIKLDAKMKKHIASLVPIEAAAQAAWYIYNHSS